MFISIYFRTSSCDSDLKINTFIYGPPPSINSAPVSFLRWTASDWTHVSRAPQLSISTGVFLFFVLLWLFICHPPPWSLLEWKLCTETRLPMCIAIGKRRKAHLGQMQIDWRSDISAPSMLWMYISLSVTGRCNRVRCLCVAYVIWLPSPRACIFGLMIFAHAFILVDQMQVNSATVQTSVTKDAWDGSLWACLWTCNWGQFVPVRFRMTVNPNCSMMWCDRSVIRVKETCSTLDVKVVLASTRPEHVYSHKAQVNSMQLVWSMNLRPMRQLH